MATLSMTGFGEASIERDGLEIVVEIKSVNHRFLDVVCKLPGVYSRFETGLARVVRERLKRGRVDLFIGRKETGDSAYDLCFNQTLYEDYLGVFRSALKQASVTERQAFGPLIAAALNRKEVLELVPKEVDASGDLELLEGAVVEALEKLIEMRAREGAELEAELLGQLSHFESLTKKISEQAVTTPLDYKERLTARLERLAGDVAVDPERLAQEVAVLSDRIDVTEELARLKSHILQFRDILEKGEGGRKLEFLLQEITREINTTGSKAQNSDITGLVVEAKAVVEKLREQVQNVE